MIFGDRTDQLRLVAPQAARFLEEHANCLEELPEGRFDLDESGDTFVNIVSFTTKKRTDAQFETHRVYADIHVPLRGEEVIEVIDAASVRDTTPYSEADDIAFQGNEAQGASQRLKPGTFLLVMPEDAHMPGVAAEEPAMLKKAIFKIKASDLIR